MSEVKMEHKISLKRVTQYFFPQFLLSSTATPPLGKNLHPCPLPIHVFRKYTVLPNCDYRKMATLQQKFVHTHSFWYNRIKKSFMNKCQKNCKNINIYRRHMKLFYTLSSVWLIYFVCIKSDSRSEMRVHICT